MKKRVQFKRIDDVVRGYVKEGITSYGSGYGILPYFESGVGVSSFYKIFDNLGLKLTEVTDELYRITRK